MYLLPTYPKNRTIANVHRISVSSNFHVVNDSWLLKNEHGLWEMYVAGDAIERGNKIGLLSKELINKQEEAVIEYIKELIPSNFMFNLFRIKMNIYNRSLGKYIPEENKEEIYSISRHASSKHNRMGNNYQRMMNYHSAHDIGQAMQFTGFSGCSALAVWGDKTQDGNLLIGRNFDFNAGDKFAEDKILLFVNPAKGYRHAFVTWGGMIGVVSGMNERGLCVLVNSVPSDIPFSAATPVTILARRILQYAKNIDEAISIAKKNKVFISEQFIIASAEDNKAVTIEKTRNSQAIYSTSMPYMLCANHFQSSELSSKTKSEQSPSQYRMDRMAELLDSTHVFTPHSMVALLRDKKGKNGANIGLGNENCINQLIAHHSIVFHPNSKTLWISTFPYQEGAFLAYNLNKFFSEAETPKTTGFSIAELMIPANYEFIKNQMANYNFYKYSINTPVQSFNRDIRLFINSNPEHYRIYEYLGDYYAYNSNMNKAQEYYELSLKRNIPNEDERNKIRIKLNNIKLDNGSVK
jgi:predicted choloylglycine hydrolase